MNQSHFFQIYPEEAILTFRSDPEAHEGINNQGFITIRKCFDDIEGRLEGVHSVGNAFTAVDAYLLVFWRWGKSRVEADMERVYPKYSALAKAVLIRDSTKAAIEAEGISVL